MAETTTTIRKNVLVDVKVEADLSGMLWCRYRGNDIEREAKDLERAAKDFHDFLRDHRSQDMVSLDIIRIRKDICVACGAVWEGYIEDGHENCASCGAVLEETLVNKGD